MLLVLLAWLILQIDTSLLIRPIEVGPDVLGILSYASLFHLFLDVGQL
jgi:hypothetical protein